MAAADWKTVRVHRDTHARLSTLRDDLHRLYVEGRVSLPDDQAEAVSLDYMINRLCDELEAHRRRAREQRRRPASAP